jgi:hypothetical protein
MGSMRALLGSILGRGNASAPLKRSAADHGARIQRLQREYASPLQPPPDAHEWPDNLLKRWFEGGGTLTVDALAETPSAVRGLVDSIGAGYSTEELQLTRVGAHDTLLGAIHQKDDGALTSIAQLLVERYAVACRLGLSTSTLRSLRDEGGRAHSAMRPGELRAHDGSIVAGESPSGAARGDRFVFSRKLLSPRGGGASAWPALAAADEALAAVGSALSPRFEPLGLPRLSRRSDSLFACFPGDGLGYGSHLDGGVDEGALVTAILYTSDGWSEEHGGRLHMLDESRQCWWALPPRADTVVLFRSDRVLHKVEACFAPRYALTRFFVREGPEYQRCADLADERAALVGNLSSLY